MKPRLPYEIHNQFIARPGVVGAEPSRNSRTARRLQHHKIVAYY
jgi:hypothetical protein